MIAATITVIAIPGLCRAWRERLKVA